MIDFWKKSTKTFSTKNVYSVNGGIIILAFRMSSCATKTCGAVKTDITHGKKKNTVKSRKIKTENLGCKSIEIFPIFHQKLPLF